MKPTPDFILKNTFGYDTFRPLQQEVINNVLSGQDTLAVMPTGGGKSLCYQIPALMFDGLTLVVSPLIALMADQVQQLRALGVPALFLNSSLCREEYQHNMHCVKRGEVKLLYVAPETLLTRRILSLLSAQKVSCLTIDEAHCISEWGHDFRPEYRKIADVRNRFPAAVCLALTATATARVRSDIRSSLKFSNTSEFVAGFDRENLHIEVRPKKDPAAQTLELLKRFEGQSGIIYCFSRRQVDELAAYIASKGYSVRPYHAGMEDEERRRNQYAFIRDDVLIIVSTIAFGMGINKPNVRFVLHHDLPRSIEGYYQEIGRAGRDGLPAHCVLLYNYSDVAKINYFIEQKTGNEQRIAMQHLKAMVSYAEDELTCRRKPLLQYFGETYSAENCGACDNCTSAPTPLSDITIAAQKFLSCVKRADEKFGAGHLTDILLGSNNEKVLRWGHHKLSTHGIGAEMNRKQWMHLSRQLVLRGYLEQEGSYNTLRLTDKARTALKKREPILGVLPDVSERVQKQKQKKAETEYNPELFDLLRRKRKKIADDANLPPYVIFSDKTLIEMASYYPHSIETLLNISGVGHVKAEKYGVLFLEVITGFCKEQNLKDLSCAKSAPFRRAPDTGAAGGRNRLIAKAFNETMDIVSVMKRFNVKLQTVLDHLTKYLMEGGNLSHTKSLDPLITATSKQRQAVFASFDKQGTLFLRPVHEKLNGALCYDELKILRLLYLISRQKEN